MKAESNVRPNNYTIDIIEEKAIITFYDEIEEVVEEDATKYKYKTYELRIQNKDNLEEEINADFETYLKMAKETEKAILAKEIREKRNLLLSETDKYVLEDYPISEVEREKYKEYRQALRDITNQENFPYNVDFPVKP